MLAATSIRLRAPERDELAALQEQFLAAGGQVDQLAITDRQPEPVGKLRDRVRTQLHLSRNSRRELDRKDKDLARRAAALTATGLGAVHIRKRLGLGPVAVSYTHLRAHETREDLVCRLLLEKKKTLLLG